MKHLKLFENFTKESSENIQFTYDLVDYDAKKIDENTFEIDNIWGMNGIEVLKRINGWREPCGWYGFKNHCFFEVTVEENKVQIELYPELLKSHNDNIPLLFGRK